MRFGVQFHLVHLISSVHLISLFGFVTKLCYLLQLLSLCCIIFMPEGVVNKDTYIVMWKYMRFRELYMRHVVKI